MMNTKKFVTTTLSLLAACGGVTVFGNSAMAVPPNSPGASANMNFNATTVDKECSVTVEPVSAVAPINYVVTSTPAGGLPAGSILANDGVGAPGNLLPEERATSMEATDDVTFDCNTLNVIVSIAGTTVTAPAPGSFPAGLTFVHEIDYTLGANPPVTAQALAQGGTVTSAPTLTDGNGDMAVNVISRFKATGEELPAGIYGPTVLTVTATAQ